MPTNNYLVLVAILLFFTTNIAFAQTQKTNSPIIEQTDVFHGCAVDVLTVQNPALRQAQNALDAAAYKFAAENAANTLRTPNAVLTIPVVIHIVHNNGAENISDAQAQTAIAHLNTAFQQNSNTRIQFCLAQRDPLGNATNGITRNVSPLTTMTMETEDLAVKNLNRWQPTCYLNIWVVKEILSQSAGSGVVGYAYFPAAHGQNMDGLLIEAGYFGNSVQNDAVAAHEVGHYLGLYHTFEGGCTNSNCLQDGDHVCDTPPDQTTFASCAPPTNSCTTDTDDASANNPFSTDTPDYGDDYMDYSSLACYTRFTAGQYDRMQFFLTGIRSSLLACQGCMSPCPTPIMLSLTANMTNINVGTSVNFTATATNATTYQYYINPSTILGTTQNLPYTFNTAGSFWIKCRASSGTLCNALDSVLITVSIPTVVSCHGSLDFEGTNDAVHLPPGVQYHSSNGFTWETWFNLTMPLANTPNAASGGLRPLISAVDDFGWEDIYLGFGWEGPSTQLVFGVDGPGGSSYNDQNYCRYTQTFTPGVWYHVAGVRDYANNSQQLYVNGVLLDNKPNLLAPYSRNIATQLSYDAFWVSPGLGTYSNNPLYGKMDEVRIWNKARTAAEIQATYNACLAGNEPNLLAYYRANQSAGTSVLDATPNHLNGVLNANATWSADQSPLLGAVCANTCVEICDNGIDDDTDGLIDEGCCPTLTVSNDTTICAPNAAQISASANFTTYAWSPTTGLSNPNIRNPVATPTVTTNYVVTATSLSQNLIVNGDFTAGNVGFTSQYTYGSFSPNYYAIAYEWFNQTGHSQVEHTGNGGNYMSIDGGSNGQIVWAQAVPAVLPNTNYQFSYWALADLTAAILQVKINNTTLATTTLISDCIPTQCNWKLYTFTWNSGSNTSANIEIRDLNLDAGGNDFGLDDIAFQRICTATDTVKVKVRSAAPALNIGNDISMCNSATRTFDAGAGFAEYRWQDGSTNHRFTAFGIGKYWVTVKDSCGNTQSDTVHITLIAPPSLDLGADIHTCPNHSANLNYTTNGVFSTFQWSKNGGGTATITCATCATTTVNPTTSPTKYFLAATTVDGCTALDSVYVYLDAAVTSTRFDTLCFGASLTVGANTYTASGVYMNTFQAFNTCDSIVTTHLFIRPNLSYNMVQVRGACSNIGNDGAAAVIINNTPNYAPYTYYWGNPNDVSDTLRYAGAGVYTVLVTDKNGCSYTGSQTIALLPSPDYTFTLQPPSCWNRCDGSVTLTATGGSGVYSFFDINGQNVSNGTNTYTMTGFCNSGLPLGYHVITALDANGCYAPTNQITMGHQIAPSRTQNKTLCFGTNLNFNNHIYTQTGTYIDTVSTTGVCDSIITTNLTVLPEMTMTAVATNPTCWNSCDGSLQLTVTNGNAPFTYDYFHLDMAQGSYITTNSNNPTLFDGTFCRDNYPLAPPPIVRVAVCHDRFGCQAQASVVLPYMPIPSRTQTVQKCVSLSFNNHTYTQTGSYIDTVSTTGVCDSIITTNLTIFREPYHYDLPFQGACKDYPIVFNGHSYNQIGTYRDTIYNANGCIDTLFYLDLTYLDSVRFTNIILKNVNCSNACNGSITLDGMGDNTSNNYDFALLDAAGTSLGTRHGLSATFNNLCAGDYTMWANGTSFQCDYHQTFHIGTGQDTIRIAANSSVFNCLTNTAQITVANTTGGSGAPYTYAFGNGNFATSNTWTVTSVGTYTVSAQDVSGCTGSTSVLVRQPTDWSFQIGRDTTILLGDSVKLKAKATTFAPIQYEWSPNTHISCVNCKSPIVSPTQTTTYSVTATDAYGCTNIEQITITVKENKIIYIPNTFTPNNDGVNDFFTAFGGVSAEKILVMRIFDRWGETVYETNDISLNSNRSREAWDGTFRNQPLPPDVFAYYIEVLFINGKIGKYSGDITLLR